LIVTFLAFALAEPRWQSSTQKEEILLLVDQSMSVDGTALEAAGKFVAEANFAGAETAWMAFGGSGRIFRTLDDLKKADRKLVEPQESRIATALALASASFHSGHIKTAVLFSDGVSTGSVIDPAPLDAQNVRVHVVPVSAPDRPEVLVREVRVPSSVRTQEPLKVEAVIQSSRKGPAEVDLFRNGVRVATQKIERTVGRNEVRFDDRAADEKLLHYEVGVRASEDTIAENNQNGATSISQGSARVLLLSDHPESARYLELGLRQEGIKLSVRPAEGTPTQMSDLQNYDAVILDNIPASGLSRAQMDLLHSYVSDFGGGLLMLGGDQAYGLGGYFRTPVEDVLPVSCDFQKEEESPSLALALVIDRSGSMQGDKMELAKAAAKASADLLGPRDYISVIAFDSESYPIVPIQSAGISASIAGEIASITPGGGTNMAPAMEEALRQLSSNPAKLKHAILLTDGISQAGPFQELATQMAQNNITVSTVAVGDGSDTEVLQQIAQWGSGRYYETSDPTNIPQIFTKETMTASKSAIQEFPFLAKPIRAVDFLEGISWDQTPFLMGYVRTKAKPTSETWLVTERGDPLLTTWRFGLGTTAAFTSDARNRWAVEWLRWNGFGKFWAQLLRRISRQGGMGFSEVTTSERDGVVTVTVDALDPEKGFPADTGGSLHVAGPDGKVRTISLEKVLPGRWTANFPATARGIYSGQVLLERAGAPVDSRFFSTAKGFSQEYLLEPPDLKTLTALAKGTRGQVSPDPKTVFLTKDRHALFERELWPWLGLLALFCFVGDVGIRRWPSR
jgi:uncharacterized membrane protein/uncharacterized protein YegL